MNGDDSRSTSDSIYRRGGIARRHDSGRQRVDTGLPLRLSGVVTDTVQQSEAVTAVTSRLAGALEREDDAVCWCWPVTVAAARF